MKGRGGNDVQHKNWKGKIQRIWITIIRHGGLGHAGSRVMALFIKCDSLALRTESREYCYFPLDGMLVHRRVFPSCM